MIEKSISFRELLERPEVKSHVSDENLEKLAIELSLCANERSQKDPIAILILSGGGAWFAAFFLILFLGITGILRNEESAIIFGVIFLASAIGINKVNKINFLNQLSLAFAIAGNLLVLFGVAEKSHWEIVSVLITHIFICIPVYLFFENSFYRFVSPIGVIVIAVSMIIKDEIYSAMNLLVAMVMLLFGFLLLYKKRPTFLNPLFYSAATMLPAILLIMNFSQINWWHDKFNEPLWPSSILLCGGLIYLIIYLVDDRTKLNEPWLFLVIASIALFGVFTTPGIIVALGLLIAGRIFDDKFLTVLSYIFLPCFLLVFYYALNIDLGTKSFVIAGSGAYLLFIRWIASRCQPKEKLV